MPKRQALSDDLYDAIKESIFTGRLPAGGKINLDELRREAGVSNTPIRQALSRLEAEGFVVKEPYRGFAVAAPPDREKLEEIFEVRLLLEPTACARAAWHASATDLERLDEITARALTDLPNSAALDTAFHHAIAEAAKNSVLADALEHLASRRITYTLYGQDDNASRTWAEHAVILDALNAGDTERASGAMRQHLELSRDRHREQRPEV